MFTLHWLIWSKEEQLKELLAHLMELLLPQCTITPYFSKGMLASEGGIPMPALLRSHGGRVRAVMQGDLKIDIAV